MENQLSQARDSLVRLHDDMFKGGESFKMTLKDWIGQGSFLEFADFNISTITTVMRDVMIAKSIDIFYRFQRVYILGGQPCDRPSGLGIAPNIGTICYKEKMYSIYYWKASPDGVQRLMPVYNERRWGWVTNPPGMMSLGKGPYEGIPWEVSRSSSSKLQAQWR